MSDSPGAPSTRPRETITVRARSARALGATMMAVGALGLLMVAFEGIDSILQYAAPLALFGVLGWGAFWEPHVTVSDGGVTVANTLRTIEVPWPAVEEIDGRYGLRLRTAYGNVTAWGAGAPTGRSRARSELGEAAGIASDRLEALRAAGYLDDRRLERPAPATTWHVPLIVAMSLLAVASLTLPFLA